MLPAQAPQRLVAEQLVLLPGFQGRLADAAQQPVQFGSIQSVIAIAINRQQVLQQPLLAGTQPTQPQHQLAELHHIDTAIAVEIDGGQHQRQLLLPHPSDADGTVLQTGGQFGHTQPAVAVAIKRAEQSLQLRHLGRLGLGQQRGIAIPGQGTAQLTAKIGHQTAGDIKTVAMLLGREDRMQTHRHQGRLGAPQHQQRQQGGDDEGQGEQRQRLARPREQTQRSRQRHRQHAGERRRRQSRQQAEPGEGIKNTRHGDGTEHAVVAPEALGHSRGRRSHQQAGSTAHQATGKAHQGGQGTGDRHCQQHHRATEQTRQQEHLTETRGQGLQQRQQRAPHRLWLAGLLQAQLGVSQS